MNTNSFNPNFSKLALYEKLYWLGANSQKGTANHYHYDTRFLYAVSGAALIQMMLNKNVDWDDKKELTGIPENPPDDVLMKEIWEKCTVAKKINWFWRTGKKQDTAKTIKDWITVMIDSSTKFFPRIKGKLQEKELIVVQENKFLGVFKYKSSHISSDEQRENYQKKLVSIVLENKEADLDDFIILKILKSCKLSRLIYKEKKTSLKTEFAKKLEIWAKQKIENEAILTFLQGLDLEKDLLDLTDAIDAISDAINGIADAVGDAGGDGGGDGGGGDGGGD
jgi:hypothetical protein